MLKNKNMPRAAITSQLPFSPEPPGGRVFAGKRAVRSTDVTPGGRFRFDALARALQDVAEDDVAEAGWQASYGWLLRRCAVTVHGYPQFGTPLTLRTFCSATGPRWAQRTTTVAGPGGPLIQAVAIWAAVDLISGAPVPLGDEFFRHYGQATQGRKASARLSLPKPDAGTPGRAWPLRATDFDTAGHVNNTIAWAAVEDVLAAGRRSRLCPRRPSWSTTGRCCPAASPGCWPARRTAMMAARFSCGSLTGASAWSQAASTPRPTPLAWRPGSAARPAPGGCRLRTGAGPACRRCWPRAFPPRRRR